MIYLQQVGRDSCSGELRFYTLTTTRQLEHSVGHSRPLCENSPKACNPQIYAPQEVLVRGSPNRRPAEDFTF